MGQRPAHVKPPEYLSANPPIPTPDAPQPRRGSLGGGTGDDPLGLDPTRYGDWELKGIAVDF